MGKADRTFSFFVMMFILGFLGIGALHYTYEWSVLRFPFVVGIVTCLLCLGNLAKGARRPAAASGAGDRPLPVGRTLPAVLWVMAVVPFVFVLGYVIGLPLYVLVYLRTHEQGWVLSTALSLCTFAVIYLGFVKLLGVRLSVLPPGLF